MRLLKRGNVAMQTDEDRFAKDLVGYLSAPSEGEKIKSSLISLALGVGLIAWALHSPSDYSRYILYAGIFFAGSALLNRWAWLVIMSLTSITFAMTALACAVHFMIFYAVVAAVGAISSVLVARWLWIKCRCAVLRERNIGDTLNRLRE
jgi:hypothetical protein